MSSLENFAFGMAHQRRLIRSSSAEVELADATSHLSPLDSFVRGIEIAGQRKRHALMLRPQAHKASRADLKDASRPHLGSEFVPQPHEAGEEAEEPHLPARLACTLRLPPPQRTHPALPPRLPGPSYPHPKPSDPRLAAKRCHILVDGDASAPTLVQNSPAGRPRVITQLTLWKRPALMTPASSSLSAEGSMSSTSTFCVCTRACAWLGAETYAKSRLPGHPEK